MLNPAFYLLLVIKTLLNYNYIVLFLFSGNVINMGGQL